LFLGKKSWPDGLQSLSDRGPGMARLEKKLNLLQCSTQAVLH